MKSGISLQAAAEGLRPLLDELARLYPHYVGNNSVALFSGSTNFRQPRTTARIWGIAGTAGSFTMLILVIACANLANLVLSRIISRVRELSVRVSLGASRTRVVSHILTETLLLSILASGGGLLLAYWGSRIARSLNSDLFYGDLSIDWRTLAAAMVGTVIMTALVGLIPAWTIGKRDLALAMKDGGEQTSYSLGRVRHRQFLLAAQLAGSCLLVVVAALTLRTLQQSYDLPRSLQQLVSRSPVIGFLQNDLDNRLAEKKLLSVILSSLAVLALCVACMGIFGIVSYGVALRRKEVGIRLALGALNRSILWLMILQLIRPIAVAIVSGTIGGVAVGTAFASEHTLVPVEASVVAAALLALLAMIGFACIVPTFRALRRMDSRVLSC